MRKKVRLGSVTTQEKGSNLFVSGVLFFFWVTMVNQRYLHDCLKDVQCARCDPRFDEWRKTGKKIAVPDPNEDGKEVYAGRHSLSTLVSQVSIGPFEQPWYAAALPFLLHEPTWMQPYTPSAVNFKDQDVKHIKCFSSFFTPQAMMYDFDDGVTQTGLDCARDLGHKVGHAPQRRVMVKGIGSPSFFRANSDQLLHLFSDVLPVIIPTDDDVPYLFSLHDLVRRFGRIAHQVPFRTMFEKVIAYIQSDDFDMVYRVHALDRLRPFIPDPEKAFFIPITCIERYFEKSGKPLWEVDLPVGMVTGMMAWNEDETFYEYVAKGTVVATGEFSRVPAHYFSKNERGFHKQRRPIYTYNNGDFIAVDNLTTDPYHLGVAIIELWPIMWHLYHDNHPKGRGQLLLVETNDDCPGLLPRLYVNRSFLKYCEQTFHRVWVKHSDGEKANKVGKEKGKGKGKGKAKRKRVSPPPSPDDDGHTTSSIEEEEDSSLSVRPKKKLRQPIDVSSSPDIKVKEEARTASASSDVCIMYVCAEAQTEVDGRELALRANAPVYADGEYKRALTAAATVHQDNGPVHMMLSVLSEIPVHDSCKVLTDAFRTHVAANPDYLGHFHKEVILPRLIARKADT